MCDGVKFSFIVKFHTVKPTVGNDFNQKLRRRNMFLPTVQYCMHIVKSALLSWANLESWELVSVSV